MPRGGRRPAARGRSMAIVLQPVDASDNSVGQVTIGQVTIGQVTIGQVTIGQVTFGSLGLECDEVPFTPVYQPINAPTYGDVLQGETGWAMADDGIPWLNKKGAQQGWGTYFSFIVETE